MDKFREMRRKRQLLEREDCIALLRKGRSGVLAVNGDGGYPYTVPLNYFYEDGHIYFHGAKAGRKVDSISRDDRVSFCVVGMEKNVPSKFTTYFKSVVVFGKAVFVENEEEKRGAIMKLADKFSPDEAPEARDAEIACEWRQLTVIRVDIEHMTGKQSIELT